jgi:hypothetical protein
MTLTLLITKLAGGSTAMVKTFTETRVWKYDEEESYDALCFAIEGKRMERFMLTKDATVPNMYNIHFCTSGADALNECEKNELVNAIIDYIKPGEYLGTCGYSTKGGCGGFKRFSSRIDCFKDTGEIRTLHDKHDEHLTYINILVRI